MSTEDSFVAARKDCLARFNRSGYYIYHGDEVALYNVYHATAISSLKHNTGTFGNTGYIPTMSGIKLNQSMFEEALASDHDARRDKIFTVFKILRVDGKRSGISHGDKIYFQYTQASVAKDVFLGGNVTSKSQCIYTFNPGKGFTLHIINNGMHQNVSPLAYGAQIEFGDVSNINSSCRVWASSKNGTHNFKLLESKPQNGRQRWKIFLAGSTLERGTKERLVLDRDWYKQDLDDISRQHQTDLKIIGDLQQALHDVKHEMNQTITNKNQTLAEMKSHAHQTILKLNASENSTIVLKKNHMKLQKKFEQQLHQLNQTLLQSESNYQTNLQTEQTKINNLNQKIYNLETIIVGSFIAVGIFLFAFFIICIRYAIKARNEKLIVNSLGRDVVKKQASVISQANQS